MSDVENKITFSQNQAQELNRKLIDDCYQESLGESELFLYIDGRVRIYFGAQRPSAGQIYFQFITVDLWVN